MPKLQLRPIVTRWWFIWVVIGVLVRIVLSIITLHPDIFALTLTPAFFAYHGVFDIYRYLGSLTPQTSMYAKTLGTQDVFIYPPLTYFTLGLFQVIFRPFVDASFIPVVTAHLGDTVTDPRIFKFLFFAKLPYLFFDLSALYYLYNFFADAKLKRWAFFLWLFNPVTLYATYMIGNFDIIPTFFTIAAIYYLSRNRYDLGMLLFGIGGAYKTYPILMALPLVFYYGDSIKKYIRYFAWLVLPYIVTSLPYLAESQYRVNVLFNQKDTKFLFMELPVSGADFIYIFIVGLILICGAAAYKKVRLTDFWVYPFAVLLLFFSVTNYHPQWMIWISPFAILLFALARWARLPIIFLLASYVGVVLFFETSLNVAIFGPLFPASQHLPGLSDVLKNHFDLSQLRSLLRSLYAGVAFIIGLKILLANQEKPDRDTYPLVS